MMDADAAAARDITVRRVFDAPRELVWQAWTEPEQIARWWGKRGWSTPPSSVTMDVRPGGVFRLTSICDADGSELPLDAIYHEVVAPQRLVWGAAGARGASGAPAADGAQTAGTTAGGSGMAGPALATVTFTELGDGRTEVVFRTTVHMTEATLSRAIGGLNSALDRLAELLA